MVAKIQQLIQSVQQAMSRLAGEFQPRRLAYALLTLAVVVGFAALASVPTVSAASINAGRAKPTRTPTRTLVPPTATSVLPTSTPVPPAATPVPTTATSVPPTATPAPPTATAVPSASGLWAFTGSMTTPRFSHSMTLLQDGRVLVVGGATTGGSITFSYEVYNPATGTWTKGATPAGLYSHTATRLQDGRVLIAAGSAGTTSSYLYNPTTNSWASTGAITVIRGTGATATLLPDGRVLLAGGDPGICWGPPCGPFPDISEIYDPVTGTWSTTGTMSAVRFNHTATLLPDGRVLVAGGYEGFSLAYLTTAEIYNPATGTWSPTGSLATARQGHSATLLPDGRVLVVGGNAANGTAVTSAEIYDPASGTWADAGSLTALGGPRPATLLPNGRVLVAGGNSAVLYDPATNAWTTTGSLNTSRFGHTALLLSSGKVLAVGGTATGSSTTLASAELYTP